MVANKVVFVALLAFAFIIGIVDYLFILLFIRYQNNEISFPWLDYSLITVH